MEERTYTQKELYQFVTEYSREAREEGFDMSVGDFVDWVASREEKPIIEKQGECKECHCETVKKLDGRVYKYLCPFHQNLLCPECLQNGIAVTTCISHSRGPSEELGYSTEEEDKPVLPEKP